ncbi:MAG TPA: dihydroneopterin aldolase [Ferruginibacter sp.]|nr:dihydroneopterin aldolase [Ferruginibacter sp.]
MITLHLHNLNFFSYHGLYEEEKILGNEYEVNADVMFDEKNIISSINETINYAKIFEVIKQRMNIPTALLETVAQDLAKQIQVIDPRIKTISITIKKKNPPITNIQGSVGVSYKIAF